MNNAFYAQNQLKLLQDRVAALEKNGVPGVRDFFATSALSLLANEKESKWSPQEIAMRCYAIADAMIIERLK